MWLRYVLALGFFVAIKALETCSPKSCRGVDRDRPVCGSDGLTYPNRCHLELTRCKNQNVTLLNRGLCRNQISCLEYGKNHPTFSYKPKCRTDGWFAASQCHTEIGYCWCVTAQGLPLANTSSTYTPGVKFRCKKPGKSTIRRSSNVRKTGRVCRQPDKALFNSNLIHTFHSEWSRVHAGGLAPGPELDRTVLEWKFNKMDLDHNNVLDKNEYRDLRRLVKKVVKPTRCAKIFAKSCDMNHDQSIGRQEWAECLTRDGMDEGKKKDEDDSEEDEGDEIFHPARTPPHGVLYGGRSPNGDPNIDDGDSADRRDDDRDESTDCLSDRQTALGEQRANNNRYELYVPECTPDGRYKKIQCYKSAGYCWCVHEDTGKNIPGTSVKNETPKCDQIVIVSRPMKGCPEEKKITFISDLMDFFHTKMAREANGTNLAGTSGPAWKVSREEQVATWSFVVFDKNKNKMLDKSEWKAFKDTVGTVKALRKCGKKLPRYCDINKDRQISMTEWLDCLNTNRHMPEIAATTASPGSTRTGKNPLSVLMED